VEKDADDVGNIVYSLKDKISEIDKIVADEASRIKSFKDSRIRKILVLVFLHSLYKIYHLRQS